MSPDRFDDSRRVRYRLIGAAEWLGNGFDNDERRLSVLLTVSFDIGTPATLTVDNEMYQQRGRNYRHTTPVTADTQHGNFSRLPWDLSVGSPEAGWSGWNLSPGVRLDLRMGVQTSLHSAFRYTRIGGNIDLGAPLSLAGDSRTLSRFCYIERSTWDEWQSDTVIATVRRTGGLEHKLVVGTEAGLSKADGLIGAGPAEPIDIYQPVYSQLPPPSALQPTRYDVVRLGRGSSIAVIVITAFDDERARRRVEAQGCVAFLRKTLRGWGHSGTASQAAAIVSHSAESMSSS